MKKLIIQIPCFNEAETLGIALAALPRQVSGFDRVEWLIIDDGCTDGTVDVALAHGVDHLVRLSGHQGLAKGFLAGIDACLAAGADVIVNTDADNQYCADDIPALVGPVLEGKADIVIGARPIEQIDHFSPIKKALQRLGSAVVRMASNTDVRDAPSGFRAISREAAMRLHVFGNYTYTIETIIQAGQKGMRILSVPIRTNGDLRPSRLVKSIPRYVVRSVSTIARIFVTYRPLRLFLPLAIVIFLAGMGLGLRYLYFLAIGQGAGHIQSVILAAALLGTGTFIFLIGVLADLISTNRKLLEQIDWKLRQVQEVVRVGTRPAEPQVVIDQRGLSKRLEARSPAGAKARRKS
ncbi:MAG: glycosyltransferase family 2 protein [Inquilinus sp.]|nr:glycosyltransferase family 2 protein [Inquilinus sp.]